jgi:hypothetical protein
MDEFIAMLYFETHNFSFFLLINDIVIIWLSSQIFFTTNYMEYGYHLASHYALWPIEFFLLF